VRAWCEHGSALMRAGGAALDRQAACQGYHLWSRAPRRALLRMSLRSKTPTRHAPLAFGLSPPALFLPAPYRPRPHHDALLRRPPLRRRRRGRRRRADPDRPARGARRQCVSPCASRATCADGRAVGSVIGSAASDVTGLGTSPLLLYVHARSHAPQAARLPPARRPSSAPGPRAPRARSRAGPPARPRSAAT
jgi:hypothetical protein